MQVHQTSLQELIQGERQYRIPLFQRQYTWGSRNHQQLWDDILDQYERAAVQGTEGTTAGTAASGHFMGSLVLAAIEGAFSERVRPALVVDGQQRLTTLLLALCAIRDVRAAHDPAEADFYDDLYLTNKWQKAILRYRLVPTQADRASFFACIDSGAGKGGSDGIGTAYRFFMSKLAGDPDLDLDRLTNTIVQRLVFVDITTDSTDNPHRIFEPLNATGIDLTQSDLLRNYFFMLLPTRADEVYEQVWRPLEQLIGFEHLEGLARVDLQRQGIDVTTDDVYRAHQKQLQPVAHDEETVEQRVRDLAFRAGHYKRLIDPSTETDPGTRDRLEFLRRWGAQTIYPLVMHLFDLQEQGRCTPEEMHQALAYTESFLVRRMLTGVSPKALNRLFIQVIGQLDSKMPAADAVQQALSHERYYWATDDELRAAVRTRNFYFSGRSEQKYLILRRLEESFSDPEMVDFAKAKLTIEHVLPQTLSDEWRAYLIQLGQDPEQVRNELVHTLGNLTLTAYNGVLSNGPFERKKQILESSHLRLNRALRENEAWGRDEILARAGELAEAACLIWPGPIPGARGASGGFDWSRIDAAVAAIPAGYWTTYGDLAELGGTSAGWVGQHVANAPNLVTAHRVLGVNGKPRPEFQRGDPADARSVQDVLRDEGVKFDPNGVADVAQHLRPTDLRQLVGAIEEEPLDADWDAALVERALRESGPPMRQFMYELADRAGEWVPIQELADALSVGNRYIPGMLGAFTVRCRSRYKRSTWPFRWEYRSWTYGYKMAPEVADIVLRLRDELGAAPPPIHG